MKKQILKLLIFILSITSQAQTWNTQLVDPGMVLTNSSIITKDGNYYIFFVAKNHELYLSKYNGVSWATNKIHNINIYPIKKYTIVNTNNTIFCLVAYLSSNGRDSYYYFIEMDANGLVINATEKFRTTNWNTIDYALKYREDALYLFYTNNFYGQTHLFFETYDIITEEWSEVVTIDGSTNLIQPSACFDINGQPYIAYKDDYGKNLKIATVSSGIWRDYYLDTEGDVGDFSQIFMDASGYINITYYNATNQELKQAKIDPSQL